MRKSIIAGLIAAVLMPAAAQAQSRAEVRRDREELREERRELRDAQRYGDRRDIREERRDVRDARQELREDRRDFRENRRERRAYRQGYTRYYAPQRDWTYRPVRQGFNLRPSFYGERYYAPGHRSQGYARWIRYGDDLLLVNTRNGRVLQVRRDYYY